MKKMIMLAFVALTGSIAFAGALDVVQEDYASERAAGTKTACVDGDTRSFQELANGFTDRYVTVKRTCVNGSYYARKAVKARACKEGATLYVSESNGFNDRAASVAYICINGKYVERD